MLTHDAQSAYDVARRIRTGGIAQNGLQGRLGATVRRLQGSRASAAEGGVDGLTAYLETKTIYMDAPVVAA